MRTIARNRPSFNRFSPLALKSAAAAYTWRAFQVCAVVAVCVGLAMPGGNHAMAHSATDGQPPLSNRGALKPPFITWETLNGSDCTSCVDWLSFTVKTDFPTDWPDRLGLPDWDEWQSCRGFRGYKDGLEHGSIKLFYGDDHGTSYLNLSGEACREIERLPRFRGWQAFLLMVRGEHANITRLDFALDYRGDILTADDVAGLARAGDWRCPSSRLKVFESWVKSNGAMIPAGTSVYFGAPSGRVQVRIYDKAAQTETSALGSWLRTELQARDEAATGLALALSERGSLGGVEALSGWLALTASTDRHKRAPRRALDPRWAALIGSVESRDLGVSPQVVTDPDRKLAWLRRQVSGTVAGLTEAGLGDAVKDSLAAKEGTGSASRKGKRFRQQKRSEGSDQNKG